MMWETKSSYFLLPWTDTATWSAERVRAGSCASSLVELISGVLHDVADEVLVLHHAVGVGLDVPEDLVDLGLGEGLSEGGEDVLDLDGEDEAVGLLVEDFHTLGEVFLGAGGGEGGEGGEDGEELVEGDLLGVEVVGGGEEKKEKKKKKKSRSP